jgi:hypothetical protein
MYVFQLLFNNVILMKIDEWFIFHVLVDLCWVFVLAALLLKQISLFCKLEPMFQHVVRQLCKMLYTMFQHPGMVQCAWVHAFMYECPLFIKETIFPELIDQETRISSKNQLWNISKLDIIF